MREKPTKLSSKPKCLAALILLLAFSVSRSQAAPEPGAKPEKSQSKAAKNQGQWTELPFPDKSWEKLVNDKNRKPHWHLSTEEQNKILHERIPTGMMMGSFYEYTNLLYCSREEFLQTPSVDIAKTNLHTVHVKDYKPTRAELFESIARQTGSTIVYNPTFFSKWVAMPTPMPLPYSIKIADHWKAEDRGMYVAYIPDCQPVGMDIYMLGRYSELTAEKLKEVRNGNALNWGTMVDSSATLEKMKEVKIGDSEALYYETTSVKRPGNQWRQWSFIKGGEAFLIVSSIDQPNAAKLVPQVEEMVASFKLVEPPPPSPGL